MGLNRGWTRRLETRALLLAVAISGALWTFFVTAGEVLEGETRRLDRRLLLLLRNPLDPADPLGPRSLEEAVRDVTALGGFTVLAVVTTVAALAFLFHGRRRHALLLVATVLAAQVSGEFAKSFYGRARPDLVPHGMYVYSASFPSGHSTMAAATYLTLAVLLASLEPARRAKALVFCVAAILVLSIGVSRVYLGVHWPTDVLAGWCLGSAWALAAWFILGRLGNGRTGRSSAT